MTLDNVVQVRPFNYCVVDEADSILIDEARTPLIISRKGNITDNIKVLIVSKSIIQSTTNITNFIYKCTCIYMCSFCNIHASSYYYHYHNYYNNLQLPFKEMDLQQNIFHQHK